jgi:hypothetical protein
MSVRLALVEERVTVDLVPRRLGAGNSGALSLEPFEMFGLNFQVSIEHIGTGSTGERKKE